MNRVRYFNKFIKIPIFSVDQRRLFDFLRIAHVYFRVEGRNNFATAVYSVFIHSLHPFSLSLLTLKLGLLLLQSINYFSRVTSAKVCFDFQTVLIIKSQGYLSESTFSPHITTGRRKCLYFDLSILFLCTSYSFFLSLFKLKNRRWQITAVVKYGILT